MKFSTSGFEILLQSMSKILKSIFTIGLATILMTVGTYAAFSSQSLNKGNTISTGTVILQADSDTAVAGIQSNPIFDNLSEIKAGNSNTRLIFMKNGGSLGLEYNSSVAKSGGDDILFSSFRLKVGTTSGGGDLYDGPMSGFSGFSGGGRFLGPGIGENIYFTVSLPSDAGSEVENKSLTVNFIFNGVQSP